MEYLAENKEIKAYEKHSFPLNLMMISGHTELWKSLIYPCTDLLPINGLEYQYEEKAGRTKNFDLSDFWRLSSS